MVYCVTYSFCYCSQNVFSSLSSSSSSSWRSFVLKAVIKIFYIYIYIVEWMHAHKYERFCCFTSAADSMRFLGIYLCICMYVRHHTIQNQEKIIIIHPHTHSTLTCTRSSIVSLFHLSLSWNHFSTELICLIWQFFVMIRIMWMGIFRCFIPLQKHSGIPIKLN